MSLHRGGWADWADALDRLVALETAQADFLAEGGKAKHARLALYRAEDWATVDDIAGLEDIR